MKVPVHGACIGQEEKDAVKRVADRGWFTHGVECLTFEKLLAEYIGVRHALVCNSGSSANLLAISALTAKELGDARIKPGDEVITTALNFPTTLNPIIQVGAIPVFVDVDMDFTVSLKLLQAALSEKTKAVVINHHMGFMSDIAEIKDWCYHNDLWLVEDCCDALGSEDNKRKAGSFGDLATLSFFTAHTITTGEGGAVLVNDGKLAKYVHSFRNWGRDCMCEPGQDNVCGHRYRDGYDHKYMFARIGYNLKMTETQAAMGVVQMAKLKDFIAKRRSNYNFMLSYDWLEDKYILPYEDLPIGVSPFGFPLICKDGECTDITRYLEEKGVGNRRIFGGNLLRQPAYKDIAHRVSGRLDNTDRLHNRCFFIGCWPGLDIPQLDYAMSILRAYYDR